MNGWPSREDTRQLYKVVLNILQADNEYHKQPDEQKAWMCLMQFMAHQKDVPMTCDEREDMISSVFLASQRASSYRPGKHGGSACSDYSHIPLLRWLIEANGNMNEIIADLLSKWMQQNQEMSKAECSECHRAAKIARRENE